MNKRWTIAVGALALTGVAEAGTGYDDEGAWQAAAGTFQKEDFEGFANLSSVTRLPSVDLYLNRLNTLADGPTVMAVSTTGGNATSGTQVLVNQSAPVLPGLGPLRLFSTKPGQHLRGVGYWNTGGDDSTVIRVYGPGGVLLETYDTGTNNLVFAGVITNQVVSYIEIDAGSIGNGYITLDDLQVTFAPTPAGVTLPLPFSVPNQPLHTYEAGITASCAGPVCDVEVLGAPPFALGVVHAVPGEPPSPASALGLVAARPLALRLGLVKAGAEGAASFAVARSQLTQSYVQGFAPPGAWTVQVTWLGAAPTASEPVVLRYE